MSNTIGLSTSPSPSMHPDQQFYSNGVPVPVGAYTQPTAQTPDSEGADAKRRRIARACDMCRKKKVCQCIKCDGKLPSCTHCVNYKTECIFTVVEKKRNPPKGAKYIEGLENRLGRMESLLKLSGLLPEGDENTDLGDLERRLQQSAGSSQRAGSQVGRSSSESVHTPTSSTLQSHLNSPAVTRGDEVEVETLSDQMCSLVTNNCGETRFIGSSSGFSIFSPKGIQWVNEKTGDTSFQQMIQEATLDQRRQPFSIWKQDMCGDIFDRQGKNPLPTKEKASLLIQDFFQGFNVLFPLFHRPSFEVYFEKQYTSDPPGDSGWYAAFNIVLAISCRLRISHSPDSTMTPVVSHIQEAWKYFQNAAAVLTELLLRNTDLMSIQAILGMALFMQGTANPQPSYFLIAAAVRIATSIGMHRRGSSFGLNPIETEQRRRIFWILYMLDKDMALRSGRPPCINDDDCNVELPDENPLDGVGDVPLQNGKGKFNLFRSMINFAIIESKVYMQLYSAKASRQSDGELLNTIGDLDKELEEWKEAMPKEFSPDNELSPTAQKAKIMHVVILHFAYYNCLTTIHRMSIHHGYWTSRLSNYALAGLSARPLNPRVFSSAALCVSAARSTINLIKYLDPKDYPCIWLVMYYPVSALVTLFANILQNPQDVNAKTDLALIHDVVDFLRTVLELDEVDEGVEKFEDGSVNRMLVVCGEFERIAKLVQEKAEKEGVGRRKRKTGDGDGKSAQRAQAQRAVQGGSGGQTGQPSGLSAMGQSDPQQGGLRPMDVNPSLFPSNLAPDDTSAFSPSNSLAWLNEVDLDPHTPHTNQSDTAGTPTGGPSAGVDPSQIGIMPGAFDQPFVPTDLWQMPMTFEWDWALDMGQTPWDGQNPL